MQKVQIDDTGAVLFFEDGEYRPPDPPTQEWLRSLTEAAGLRLPSGTLTAEWFQRNGRSVLFVTGLRKPAWVVCRFDSADDLMDAVRETKPLLTPGERSELYEYEGQLYLALAEPGSALRAVLSEFGSCTGRDTGFLGMLGEHGRQLAAPSALSRMARYF